MEFNVQKKGESGFQGDVDFPVNSLKNFVTKPNNKIVINKWKWEYYKKILL